MRFKNENDGRSKPETTHFLSLCQRYRLLVVLGVATAVSLHRSFWAEFIRYEVLIEMDENRSHVERANCSVAEKAFLPFTQQCHSLIHVEKARHELSERRSDGEELTGKVVSLLHYHIDRCVVVMIITRREVESDEKEAFMLNLPFAFTSSHTGRIRYYLCCSLHTFPHSIEGATNMSGNASWKVLLQPFQLSLLLLLLPLLLFLLSSLLLFRPRLHLTLFFQPVQRHAQKFGKGEANALCFHLLHCTTSNFAKVKDTPIYWAYHSFTAYRSHPIFERACKKFAQIFVVFEWVQHLILFAIEHDCPEVVQRCAHTDGQFDIMYRAPRTREYAGG
mmetsp:Transcript_38077/g.98314  ORF Transcript_38077/g.98314 Transcript_38077/m.98314 type:complete len:334 (+) Transcript_38077:148-1149(+)